MTPALLICAAAIVLFVLPFDVRPAGLGDKTGVWARVRRCGRACL